MKFNSLIFASSVLLSIAQAAPALITRYHTAPTSTQWKTYTTNTVTKVETTVIVVNGSPTTLTTTKTSTLPDGQANAETSTNAQPDAQPTETSITSTDEQTDAQPTDAPTDAQTDSQPTQAETSSAQPTDAQTDSQPTEAQTEAQPTQAETSSAQPTQAETTSQTQQTSATPTTLTSSTAPATSTTSSAPSSSSSSSSSNLNDFEQEILDEHNTKRALSGAQALVWNNTLAQYAADYAKSSFSCDNVQLIHSDGPYGENLAAGYSGGKDPVDAWYDEIKYYDFSNPGFSEKTGHYTQLVWQSSSQMGCAKVDCNNSWKQYTICEYSDTRGNIVGTDPKSHKNFFAENVIKPSSS